MKIALLLLVAVVMMMEQKAHSLHDCNVHVRRGWLWGKREVRDADFDAAYNAAAEDGVLTDEEIQSVFGVDVAEFKESFDMNRDGVVQVEEYELVNTISSNVNQVKQSG